MGKVAVLALLAAIGHIVEAEKSCGAGGCSPDEDALSQALAAEEEVCDASKADCEALELRQLRAKQVEAEVQAHKAATESKSTEGSETEAEYGDDAVGKNMWTEPTYHDIIEMMQANMSKYCQRDSGGSCMIFGCKASRGLTECHGGSCMCAPGSCAVKGRCYPRNPTTCDNDSGGTCAVGFCKSSRGETKCKSGRCLCKTGHCAAGGACYPVTDTGGSCSLLSCSSSRGPTTCHRGRCLCTHGYVAIDGVCLPLE